MTEQAVHAAIVSFLSLNEDPSIWVYWHANNGAHLTGAQAAQAQARGVRAGVPDLVLTVRGRVAWAEIKAGRGRLSDAQKAWLDHARRRGEPVFVLRSIADAEAMLESLGVPLRARVAA